MPVYQLAPAADQRVIGYSETTEGLGHVLYI